MKNNAKDKAKGKAQNSNRKNKNPTTTLQDCHSPRLCHLRFALCLLTCSSEMPLKVPFHPLPTADCFLVPRGGRLGGQWQ
jgi:hypothetical protein